MKTPEERIEALEKTVRTYRLLVLTLVLLITVSQRYRIVGWIDSVESWFAKAAIVGATQASAH